MSGKPQSLSEGQKEEVIKILHMKIFNGLLIGLTLLTCVTGLSLWGIKNRLENKLEYLIAKQFEEPHIQEVVSNVAERRAEKMLVEQINPKVEQFRQEIVSKLSDLKSLIDETQKYKIKIVESAKQIEAILYSVKKSLSEIEAIKATIVGIHSNLAILERGLVGIQYYTYKGRNQFPNPYHDRIIQILNELLIIAVPNPSERVLYVKELEAYQPDKKEEK